MATPAQIAANRRNAQASTDPAPTMAKPAPVKTPSVTASAPPSR